MEHHNDKQELVKIVERAGTLAERYSDAYAPRSTEKEAVGVDTKMNEWCQVVAQGDEVKFNRRLTWDGLDPKSARALVGRVSLNDANKLPEWISLLKRVLSVVPQKTDVVLRYLASERRNTDREIYPYEEILWPFTHVAWQELKAQAGDDLQQVSTKASYALVRNLRCQLSRTAAWVLQQKFTEYRQDKNPLYSLFPLVVPEEASSSQELYYRFVQAMLRGELREVLKEYSVLARLLAQAVAFWIEATVEFLSRLAADRAEIRETFACGNKLGVVVALESSLSDPHRRGRRVFKLTFTSGLALIYKPRSFGLARAFFGFSTWLGKRGAPITLKRLKVLDRSVYGWIEHVKYAPCVAKREVRQYYQRAGALLCLVYSLGGSDCHYENIIACGQHPMLIDLETLLQPRMQAPVTSNSILDFASEQIYTDSVLNTGLLPATNVGPKSPDYDISGFSGNGGQTTSFRETKWEYVNTDGMRMNQIYATTKPQHNLPVVNGIQHTPGKYVEDIVEGFRCTYLFLMTHKEEILHPNGPLADFHGQPARFVFRSSRIYKDIRDRSLRSKFLREGVDRSIQLDLLSRAFVNASSRPPLWPLRHVEIQSIEQMDIPHFEVATGSRTLCADQQEIVKDCFASSGYERAVSRINSFDLQDLEQQVDLIRSSLGLRLQSTIRENVEKQGEGFQEIQPLNGDQLVHHASIIAEKLQRKAIYNDNGEATWITVGPGVGSDQYSLQPMRLGLYSGSGGVALFLAAFAMVYNSRKYRDLACAALQPLQKAIQRQEDNSLSVVISGLGGVDGYGSAIYVLVKAGQFLREKSLIDDAFRIALRTPYAQIEEDHHFDVLYGMAGAILGLLALQKIRSDQRVLDRAVACGDHLLKCRTKSRTGYNAWKTLDGKMLTGFSHGASGIMYALSRLYDATGERRFLEAALEAVEYENSVFSSVEGNWPDLRTSVSCGKQPAFQTMWCHGAVGIGLARLGLQTVSDDTSILNDIWIAAQNAREASPCCVDHICCGNFGISSFLHSVGCQFSKPVLIEVARKRAAWVLNRAKSAGGFRLISPHVDNVYNPSLYRGAAGIGYELLRMSAPDKLPSILLWE